MIFRNIFTNSLARRVLRQATAMEAKWPPPPVQEYKDYQIITTRVELLSYFTRCLETGFCSFDFETAPSDAEWERWNKKEAQMKDHLQQIQENLKTWTANGNKQKISIIKKMEKDFLSEYQKQQNDFKRSPLDPHRNKVCSVSLSAEPNEARVIFLDHKKGDNSYLEELDRESAVESFFNDFEHQILMNESILKIAYNLAFEVKVNLKHKVYINNKVADPLVMIVRTLQAYAPNEIKDAKNPSSGKGLKPMAKRFLNVKMEDFLSVVNEAGYEFFDQMSNEDPAALKYSAEDADYALQLYLYFNEIAKKIEIEDCIYKNYSERLHVIDMPFQRVIGEMEYCGFTWNKSAAELAKKEAEKQMDEAIKKIRDIGNEVYYDLKSKGRNDIESLKDIDPGKTGKNNVVRFLLFDILKAPKPVLSELTGKPSLDHSAILDMIFMIENNMKSIEDEYDESEELIELQYEHKEYLLRLLKEMDKVQKYGTLLSSHIYGREKYINPVTGRIHASFTPWTETGRLNSFSPNGQNVPRADTDKFGIRNVYQPAEDKVLVMIDYSGFELRLIAWASGDETMLDILNNNGDIHLRTAATLTGKPMSEITKEERMAAKSGNFGIGYGGTQYALRSTYKKMGIRKSLDYCQSVVDAVKKTYPGIPIWQQQCVDTARERGYAQTIYGYRRLLPGINSPNRALKNPDERRAANTPIQGSAADIMKKAQNEIFDRIAEDTYKSKILKIPKIFVHGQVDMIQQFHDEIVLEVVNKPSLIINVVEEVKAIMEKPPIENFPVKLIAEPSIAIGSWGNKIDYEEWLKGVVHIRKILGVNHDK